MRTYLDLIIIFILLRIMCIVTQTFAQHSLLDNILALPLLHDEDNLTFDKWLNYLDRQLHKLTKE